MTDFSALATIPEAELRKMKRDDIIKAILFNRFMFDHHRNKAIELQKQIDQNQSNERAACVMLAAFVGAEIPKNEYSGQIDSSKMNILELAGLVCAKCARA